MYDPLVVDTFVARLSELEEEAYDLGPVSQTLVQIAELSAVPAPSSVPRMARAEGAPTLSPTDAVQAVMALLRGRSSDVGCVYLAATATSTKLSVHGIAGNVPPELRATTVEIGDRVIGWSAATSSVVRNASIHLEFKTSDPRLATISVLPSRTTDGMAAALVLVAGEQGISELDHQKVEALNSRMDGNVSDTPQSTALSSSGDRNDSLGSYLGIDRRRADASFPLGIVAVRLAGGSLLPEAMARRLIRASDSFIPSDDGTMVFLLQRASMESVDVVVSRIREACEGLDSMPSFHSTVLKEESAPIDRAVSDVINRLWPGFHVPQSDKLH